RCVRASGGRPKSSMAAALGAMRARQARRASAPTEDRMPLRFRLRLRQTAAVTTNGCGYDKRLRLRQTAAVTTNGCGYGKRRLDDALAGYRDAATRSCRRPTGT